ncbi:hypothetical protein [Halomonas sp.]|uniref:hypothetical protein n=1 Tax=Halomonas sp. TaxID=1486246 RepID=UPI000C89C5DC|nr:hypothetical protein [Halomonas sp.]MAR73781.1 hypothetical protein [Halomonas sp.]|tara:strand:- start:5132 stop:5353 length:222 start_codon:yes stop_codon:yes gene_type:complete
MTNIVRFPVPKRQDDPENWKKIEGWAVEKLHDALLYVQCTNRIEPRMLEAMLDEVLQKGIKSKRCMSVGFGEG